MAVADRLDDISAQIHEVVALLDDEQFDEARALTTLGERLATTTSRSSAEDGARLPGRLTDASDPQGPSPLSPPRTVATKARTRRTRIETT
jgi:hypothetical protein